MSLSTFLSKLDIAQEAIQFQKDDFGERLNFEIEEICKKIDSNECDDKYLKTKTNKMVKIIFDRLGIKVKFESHILIPAATLPVYKWDFHMFYGFDPVEFEEQQRSTKDSIVDTKRAKISGGFSEVTNILFMNFRCLRSGYKLTSREITAVMLHELGHDFTFFEYSKRLEATNQVMAEIATIINSDNKEDKRQYVYKQLKKLKSDISDKEIDKILSEDQTMASIELTKIMFHSLDDNKNQLTSPVYSQTSSEQLADNFAVKFGFGEEIVTGLDKLCAAYGAWWNSLAHIVTFIFLPFLFPIGTLITILNLIFEGDRFRDWTYDDLKVRYQRVRNLLVQALKSQELTSDEVAILLKKIKTVDEIIKNAKDFLNLYRIISNFVFPFNRRARSEVEEEKLRELLASSDLFIRSAEFKLMGKK